MVDPVDAQPAVSTELLQLAEWMSSYYHPLGEVLATVLPAATRGAEFTITPADCWQVIDPDYSKLRAPRQQQLLAFLAARPAALVQTS